MNIEKVFIEENNKNVLPTQKSKRDSNFELLRIITMLAIVIAHFFNQSGMQDELNNNSIIFGYFFNSFSQDRNCIIFVFRYILYG